MSNAAWDAGRRRFVLQLTKEGGELINKDNQTFISITKACTLKCFDANNCYLWFQTPSFTISASFKDALLCGFLGDTICNRFLGNRV